MITAEKKQKIIAENAISKSDTGSAAVQVAILTERIKELTEHLKVNKKDFATRRGLLQMVGRRKRLLKFISEKDSESYLKLIKKLGLRR
jgi:small subunit ribosomal protein S15